MSRALPVSQPRRRRRAFSLVEVMVASCVLMLGISGALVTLQRSLASIAQARQLDTASQLMQTELERLRLLNWSQLQTLQDSRVTRVPTPSGGDFARFTCERSIRDLREGMKEITLVASWGGLDGRAYSARLITRYGRSGLNDYFYTTR
jgi:type II secretory pathway pseudopilin PulG